MLQYLEEYASLARYIALICPVSRPLLSRWRQSWAPSEAATGSVTRKVEEAKSASQLNVVFGRRLAAGSTRFAVASGGMLPPTSRHSQLHVTENVVSYSLISLCNSEHEAV